MIFLSETEFAENYLNVDQGTIFIKGVEENDTTLSKQIQYCIDNNISVNDFRSIETDIRDFSKLMNLSELNNVGIFFKNSISFGDLSNLKKLTILNLENRSSKIVSLKSLKMPLNLDEVSIQGKIDGIANFLDQLPSTITELGLNKMSVSNLLSKITRFSKVEHLSLTDTEMTYPMLDKLISKMKSLNTVWLQRTPIAKTTKKGDITYKGITLNLNHTE